MAKRTDPTGGAPHIVIVGGGAGGLVLATLCGRRLARKGRARVTLVDRSLVHVWKPLLHEIAAGTLNSDTDRINFLSHASEHHFRFVQGEMTGLDADAREITLAAMPAEDGAAPIPERRLGYDMLVLAVGSTANDFGVTGVAEHCVFLDDLGQADALQQRLLRDMLRAQMAPDGGARLGIAIVGAGATGVELAAEMHRATRGFVAYGLDAIDPDRDVKITLVEAADHVLPALSTRLQDATEKQLTKLGVELVTGAQVVEVTSDAIRTREGREIAAGIRVWCAGVRGPRFLESLAVLALNRASQIEVNRDLSVPGQDGVFAMGDCAAYTLPGSDRPVPPRAQAAYQQAYTLAATLERRLAGSDAQPFVYRDYGSLISLSGSAVGSLMGNLFGTVMIEGLLARLTYLMLYRKHQHALHGLRWVIMNVVARLFMRGTQPELKLH